VKSDHAFSHSGAQNIVAEISYQPGDLHVRVRDDGRGLDERVLTSRLSQWPWGLRACGSAQTRCAVNCAFRSSSEGETLIDLHVPANIVYRPENPRPVAWSFFRPPSARKKKAISPQTSSWAFL